MNILEFKRKSKEKQNQDAQNFSSVVPPGVSAIGIDLGTTNSVVSIFSAGAEKPVTLTYEGSNLIPSIIYYNTSTDETLVGIKAKHYQEEQRTEVIKSTKRSMGKHNASFYSNGKEYRPEEVASIILNYLVSHPTIAAEKEKFGGIWAVITVPAHFDDAARTATILAAQKVGISVLRIINEPTAAALAYSMISKTKDDSYHELKFPCYENLAVFDLGGGTFDVTVVEKNELTFNVLSSEGDINLGGDDVDDAIAEHLLKKVHPPFVARRTAKESALYRKISSYAEHAKKALQTEASYHVSDQDLDGKGSAVDVTLERGEFEEIIFPVLQKTVYLTESCIQAAKKSPKSISRILLVGGSTRLNLVYKMLSEYFPCLVDARLEPDLAVSWGASLQAAIILGIQVDTILVDVCSHTLGVGVVDSPESAQENFKLVAKKLGLSYPLSEDELERKLGDKINNFNLEVQKLLKVAPILHRNSPLPARKSEFFNTVYDNQTAVHVVVAQGEGKTVGENRLIGSFMFKLQQPNPKGTRCEIQLTYDVNGMVQVYAKQLGTANEARAHFDSRTGEVKGWSKSSEPQSEQKIVPITLGMSPNSDPSQSDIEHIPVLNAIIMRAKRVLSKLPGDTEEYRNILNLTKKYASLLEFSKNEAINDEEIEIIEEELMTYLEGK